MNTKAITSRLIKVSGAATLLLTIYTAGLTSAIIAYSLWPVDLYQSERSLNDAADIAREQNDYELLRRLVQEHMSRTGEDYFIYDPGNRPCSTVPECDVPHIQVEDGNWGGLGEYVPEAVDWETPYRMIGKGITVAERRGDEPLVRELKTRQLMYTYEVRDENFSRAWELQGIDGFFVTYDRGDDGPERIRYWGLPALAAVLLMLLNWILTGSTQLFFWRGRISGS